MRTTPQTSEARTSIRPGFAWDEQDCYLFDIDGTLLRCRDRVHFDSLASSVRQVTGFAVTLAGVILHGNTDTAIVREACAQGGIPDDVLESQLAAIRDAMCGYVADRRHLIEPDLMPGVKDTLTHLALRGKLLGVATGNLEKIGWIKIEEAGLRQWFRFGGFSDNFMVRSELIGHAAFRARELGGAHATVCVVGDTPRDIEAARANNLPVIAVATGHFSFDDLLPYHPDVCATTLTDLLQATRETQ